MRLIDAEAFARDIAGFTRVDDVCAALQKAPAIDAVPVVRCKNCRYRLRLDGEDTCRQGYLGLVRPDDFCRYGRSKEQEAIS